MTRKTLAASLTAGIVVAVALAWSFRPHSVGASTEAHCPAATYPAYRDIVIPPNFAPLNLRVLEPGTEFCLRVTAGNAAPIEVFSSDGDMRIPAVPWHRLLEAHAGTALNLDIFVRGPAGWVHYETARNRIAADAIDPYVSYRYIPPIYSKWHRLSLIERDLRSFEERVLFDNQDTQDSSGRTAEGACFNCHTFLNRGTRQMLLHVRPSGAGQVPAMILVRDGKAEKLDMRSGPGSAAAYSSWHPSGRLVVFSRNRLVQVFHTAGEETREVVDLDSDLGVYDLESRRLVPVPAIARPDRLETFPAWSPDGRYLYFTATDRWSDRANAPLYYAQVRYDLQRIAFDPATGRWGEVETVVSAASLGLSISLPQISPDGRNLMFCGHAFGSFPIFQPSSDLYLLDLAHSGAAPRRLEELNSARSDSYHSWSSNSRWVIFTSKREDGRYARFYLAHLEPDGRFSKPFLMPQEDPDFYSRCLMTYNRPEMLTEPVTVSPEALAAAIVSPAGQPENAVPPPAGQSAPADTPWQPLRQ